jgi:hypothetical protein
MLLGLNNQFGTCCNPNDYWAKIRLSYKDEEDSKILYESMLCLIDDEFLTPEEIKYKNKLKPKYRSIDDCSEIN